MVMPAVNWRAADNRPVVEGRAQPTTATAGAESDAPAESIPPDPAS